MDPAHRLRRLRRAPRWAVPAAVAAVILVGSLVPPPPGRSGSTSWVASDGIVHALAYAALALAVGAGRTDAGSGSMDRRRIRRAVDAFVVAVAYGTAVELLQAPIPWRRFGTGDLLADAAGATLAATWIAVAPRVRRAAGRGQE